VRVACIGESPGDPLSPSLVRLVVADEEIAHVR
jgi:hypothetical protein